MSHTLYYVLNGLYHYYIIYYIIIISLDPYKNPMRLT